MGDVWSKHDINSAVVDEDDVEDTISASTATATPSPTIPPEKSDSKSSEADPEKETFSSALAKLMAVARENKVEVMVDKSGKWFKHTWKTPTDIELIENFSLNGDQTFLANHGMLRETKWGSDRVSSIFAVAISDYKKDILFIQDLTKMIGLRHPSLKSPIGVAVSSALQVLMYKGLAASETTIVTATGDSMLPLHHFIWDNKDTPRLTNQEIFQIMHGLAEGLDFLDEKGHRNTNLRIESVLWARGERPVMIDFGWREAGIGTTRMSDHTGVDIFDFGMIGWQMLEHKQPKPGAEIVFSESLDPVRRMLTAIASLCVRIGFSLKVDPRCKVPPRVFKQVLVCLAGVRGLLAE